MEELKDVVLHVYKIAPPEGQSNSFFSRILPSIGVRAYHTSLEVDGYIYTFAANAGIVKTRSRIEGVPQGANFQEDIFLGACGHQYREDINQIVEKLRTHFGPRAYHLVHRNCNHFTETFATALILPEALIENKTTKGGNRRLDSYPEWVNRLANMSGAVISHDDDIVPCNAWEEARYATGADKKTAWNFDNKSDNAASSKRKSSKDKNKKKELTEKQKAILAKIKGGSM